MKGLDLEMLQNLTQDILGKMAFMFVEPAEEAVDFEGALQACIDFEGPKVTGALILQGSAGFLSELASGLLGLEANEVDPEVEGLHSLKEIANVLAGEIIRELGGEYTHFALGIPYSPDCAIPQTGENDLACDFDAMGQAFRARIVHQVHAE